MNDHKNVPTADPIEDSIYELRAGGQLETGGIQRLAVVYMTMLLFSLTAIGGVALASLV